MTRIMGIIKGKNKSDSVSESYHRKRQEAIMPSEIMQLPELVGILKTPTTSSSIVNIPYLEFRKKKD